MKKLFFLFLISLLSINQSYASVDVAVESLTDFPEYSETKSLRTRVVQDVKIKEGIVFQKNAILDSKMVGIIPPKFFKRKGVVTVEPVLYIYNGLVLPIKSENLKAKMSYRVNLFQRKTPDKKDKLNIKKEDKFIFEFAL